MEKEYKDLNIDTSTIMVSSDNQVVFTYYDGSRDKVYTKGNSYYGYIGREENNSSMWDMRKANGEKDKRLLALAEEIIENNIIR